MKQISELSDILFHFLDWNKARITCLVQILQGLFLTRTVNLTQIAQGFQSEAKEQSVYRRIQRFFQAFCFDMSFIVVLVSKLFILGEKCTLIIDRTNWKWGKAPINILVLSIEYFGIGIPLFWTVLRKEGTSSTDDRTFILKKVLQAIGKEKIHVLLADREFIGEAWFRFLLEEGIPFVIRTRQNFKVEGLRNGYAVPIVELRNKLGHKKTVKNYPLVLWGHSLLASFEQAKGAKEPLIVVSNHPFTNPLKLYRWRWGIETLFSCLKSRGFRMEDTHMTDPAKIEKLLFILTIAVAWAYKTGELQARKVPIVIKKHGRKAKSLFRLGLDLIRQALFRADPAVLQKLSLIPYLRESFPM